MLFPKIGFEMCGLKGDIYQNEDQQKWFTKKAPKMNKEKTLAIFFFENC